MHTGQHYDSQMSDVFFKELGIPVPDVNLEVGSDTHARQTAKIMLGFEPVCEQIRPDWVVVVGDVNSTMACSLVAAKLRIKIAHVEAGLRSFDRGMPEEINRLVTDALADLLLTPSEDGDANLRKEGVPPAKIRRVGNIMIDALLANLEKARASAVLDRLGLEGGGFAYVTLHRPSNVDARENLSAILEQLLALSAKMPVVFPMHPRTRKMVDSFGVPAGGSAGLKIVEPVGYHDSICLCENARLVLTDSGGLQEEATFFSTPCLTLRPNTERPVTVELGSNQLTTIQRLSRDIREVLDGPRRRGQVPPLWDGKTGERIIAAILDASCK